MHDTPITVRRLTTVPAELAIALTPLFDEEIVWDTVAGERFLANPDCLFLLAEAGPVPCGFLTAYRLPRFDAKGAEVQLYEIGVDEAWQRRGVATALIAALDRWAREVGATEYWVITETDNVAANALYAATGGDPDLADFRMYSWPSGAVSPDAAS